MSYLKSITQAIIESYSKELEYIAYVQKQIDEYNIKIFELQVKSSILENKDLSESNIQKQIDEYNIKIAELQIDYSNTQKLVDEIKNTKLNKTKLLQVFSSKDSSTFYKSDNCIRNKETDSILTMKNGIYKKEEILHFIRNIIAYIDKNYPQRDYNILGLSIIFQSLNIYGSLEYKYDDIESYFKDYCHTDILKVSISNNCIAISQNDELFMEIYFNVNYFKADPAERAEYYINIIFEV